MGKSQRYLRRDLGKQNRSQEFAREARASDFVVKNLRLLALILLIDPN
jgi:hypothetical protein